MNQLGQFEQNLLTELREVVAEQAGAPQPRRALPRKRVALAVAGGGLLAAGLLVGLPATNSDQTPAAYAVTTNDDGTVTVKIISLKDAEGLERQLEAHGIAAEIDYNPPGKMCRSLPARYEESRTPLPPGAFKVDITRDDPGPPREWTLRPADLKGWTLVMEVDGHGPNGDSLFGIHLGFAVGPVAPCVVVDM